MRAAVMPVAPARLLAGRWILLWLAMTALTLLLMWQRDHLDWAFDYPRAWQLPLAGWISAFMKWLVNSADFILFTFKDFTRALAWVVEQPYTLVKSVLSTGFLSGVGSDAELVFPRVSWLTLLFGVVLLGHYAHNWKLATLVGACFQLCA